MRSRNLFKSSENPTFWDTDLEEIESEFLEENQDITDLPTYLDRKVPHQGSVLLDKVDKYNSDSNKSFLKRIFPFF